MPPIPPQPKTDKSPPRDPTAGKFRQAQGYGQCSTRDATHPEQGAAEAGLSGAFWVATRQSASSPRTWRSACRGWSSSVLPWSTRPRGCSRYAEYLFVEDVDCIIPAGTAAEDCLWGMREARLTDPDGNEVRVGSPLREPKPAAQV
jgi:hypothetical protein